MRWRRWKVGAWRSPGSVFVANCGDKRLFFTAVAAPMRAQPLQNASSRLLKKTPLIAGDLGMLSHGGKFDLVLHFLISKSLIWHWRVSLGRTPPHPGAHAPAGAGGGAAAACAASLAKRNKL